MVLPSQTTTIQDPGLEKVTPLTAIPYVLGVCSGAASTSANTVYTYNSAADLLNGHGEGPGVEAGARHLTRCGGPIRYIEMTQSADGSLGSVTTNGSSLATIVDNSSTPYNWFELKFKIILGGAVGTATFQYSLDGGRNYSATYTTAASFTVPNSGISVTMSSGSGDFIADEVYSGTATGPIYTATEMDSAFTELAACPLSWDYGILAGRHADASTANTIFNALDADRGALAEPHKYKPWIMDAGGSNKATTISSFTATSKWILAAYGTTDMNTPTPRSGYQTPALPNYMHAILKAGKTDLSEHWGRKASGQLPDVASWSTEFGSPISHDEVADEGLDEHGLMTIGHYDGDGPGEYYIMRGRMKAPLGSDFQRWELARMFSATNAVIHTAQNQLINRSWAVKADQTLVEAEAAAAEAKVGRAMKTLLHQQNVEGTKGHCSINGTDPGYYYRISRTELTGSTNTVRTEWGIRPRTPSEYIVTTGGFVLQTVPE